MAKQYVVTEEEMNSLLDQLKLQAMQETNSIMRDDLKKPPSMHEVHRAFHFIVVRWAQAVGFTGHR